jgi:hypothetical protein
MVPLSLRAWAAAALLAAAGTVPAQADREVQIKAAFLYKFGDFVEWPENAFAGSDDVFVIGVIGADAVAAELERVVAGRTIQERKVVVRRLKRGEVPGQLHVLFVGEAEGARLGEVLAAVKGQPLLVVTESENALQQGSVINFVPVGDKLRFDVALPPAERARLKISSRLLAVARKVVPSS